MDLALLRSDPERARASQRDRGEDPALVDAILDADTRWRAARTRADGLRAEQKRRSPEMRSLDGEARDRLREELGRLSEEAKGADADADALATEREALLADLPNLIEGAPPGGEEDFVVLEHVGSPPELGFVPRDHVELGQLLGAIDLERGAKVSGARFYFLTGAGALLELALVNLAVRMAVEEGFVPVIPPVLVRPEAMAGTGFLGRHADEVYRLAADDLYLVGTSEVPLAAYHSDEILTEAELPKRYVGISSCFRREAGSAGRDTRGIIRVHQFDKVEMFVHARLEDAAAEHQRLLALERRFLDALEIPYRVVDIAAGDLGSSAARKFDCEAWLPSQGTYREVTSTSNCTDFQARRLAIRVRTEAGVRPVATLNGTLCAVARMIVAVLENHQREAASVRVPAALVPHLGREVIEPVAPASSST